MARKSKYVDIEAACETTSEENEEIKASDLNNPDALPTMSKYALPLSKKHGIVKAPDKTQVKLKEPAGCDWMFTINNPNDHQKGVLKHIYSGGIMEVRFCVYQEEKGKDTGTTHYQGFIVMRISRKFGWMKNHIMSDVHWEKRESTRQACINYCTKMDTRIDGPWYYGNIDDVVKIDHSKDWTSIVQMCKDRKSESDICECFPSQYGRCFNGVRRMMNIFGAVRRDWKTEVYLYYGTPGTGKSKRALEESGPESYWKFHGPWWDGYNGQENVVIDDFYGFLPYTTFLQLLDRYPLLLEVKGAVVHCNIKRLWITSNEKWDKWYKYPCNPEAIARRLTYIVRYEETNFGGIKCTHTVVEKDERVKK